MSGPLSHLRVVEISNSLTGAQAGNLLADLGAEVIAIEPPGGSPLRTQAGFAFLARGKKSVVLDLHDAADAGTARRLLSEADVMVTTLRPAALERFGIGYEPMSKVNPRLVYGSVTGWGRTGPLRDAKGYEGMIMAKLGAMATSFAQASTRPGPTFATVPYASWSAAHALLQGVFAALRDRESTGAGQLVEVNLALALSAQDPWNQANAMLTQRYPDAFLAAPPVSDDGVPNYSFTFKLLVALTKDGHWLQFSQVQPHLFRAFMRSMGLEWMYDDPEWKSLPDFEDIPQRMRFWEILLTEVKKRTLAEWLEVFENDRDVFAEIFRRGTDVLHHPQMTFADQTVVLDDAERGKVLQPGPLVRLDATPAVLERSAPRLDEHGDEIRARAAAPAPAGAGTTSPAPRGSLPLEGVTVMELGTFYAAPFGATMLTDLGARVIKIEPREGDPMRVMQPFPEAGAAKVLQGKESVALDLANSESKEILARIAARSDLVLCAFRAGVADRLGVGAAQLLKDHPHLFYLDAPGFGVDGPHGGRPAFAPTMAAGSGIAMRNAGTMVPDDNVDDLAVIRERSIQLSSAAMSSAAQPDGIAALGVGTALSLAAYLQRIGVPGQHMLTTMLLSCVHALVDAVEYEGRPPSPQVDPQGYGLSALYRLYETAQGWTFLAAPSAKDWAALTSVPEFAHLADEARFASPEARRENDAELAAVLGSIFATRPAADWERELLAADVGCVVADERTVEANYLGEFGEQHGYLATVDSPVFGSYNRVGPIVSFSRSATSSTVGCVVGQHTRDVLLELGYDEETIADLAARGVILLG